MKKYLVYFDPSLDRHFAEPLTWVTRDNTAFLVPGDKDIWYTSSVARLGGKEHVLLQTDSYDELVEYLQGSGRKDARALAAALMGAI